MSTGQPTGRAVSLALQSDKSTPAYAELARRIEHWGFDGLSIYGDLGYQPPMPALMTTAAHSDRLRLGPACLNPFTTHPVEVAGQIAALDEASGGRAYLGLTRGSWLSDLAVPQDRPLAALRDTVAIVHRLLSGDTSGYTGAAYRIEPGFRLRYTPLRPRIDVLLGVWGPRGAALAAEIADEVKIGGTANPDMVRLMSSWLAERCRELGRDPAELGLVAGAVTVVDTDGEAARDRARTEVAMYLDVVAALDPTVAVDPELLAELRILLAEDRDQDAGALLSDDLLDRFAFAGTPEQVAAQASGLFEAGATRVEFGTPHGLDPGTGIDLLGARVLPLLRGTTALSTHRDSPTTGSTADRLTADTP
ncbi:LLM class flavin-dependent oxidoreductase [Ornithinimicrobium murale]|uniref:LLM class flavin-dependent oxidoreductase n=1 Tax=Ornithinimicrobium murale TaxID=1050153 RepID=UPI001EDE97AF|nr:LLM class flavin-dependent oxidoreductase [Ornithinimicrobium murale]